MPYCLVASEYNLMSSWGYVLLESTSIQVIPFIAVLLNRYMATLLFSLVVSYVMTGALIWCLLWIAQKLHIREPIKKLIGMR